MFRKTIMTAIAAAFVATASLTAGVSAAEASGFGISVSFAKKGHGWQAKSHGNKSYGHHRSYGKKSWGKTSYRTCQRVPVYGWAYGKKVIIDYKRVCR